MLVRALNLHSPLAVTIAARSLLEHHAIAVYLNMRLTKGWTKAEKKSRDGRFPFKELQSIENDLEKT